MIYRRGKSMRVMVYAGRDPLTGEAKQIEVQLLAEVARRPPPGRQGVKVAELVDRWLEWRQAVKPCHRGRPPTTDAAST